MGFFQTMGWIAWGASALLALVHAWECRSAFANDDLWSWPAAVSGLLYTSAVVVFAVFDWSKLHLLYVMPVAWLVGTGAYFRRIPILATVLVLATKLYVIVLVVGTGKRVHSIALSWGTELLTFSNAEDAARFEPIAKWFLVPDRILPELFWERSKAGSCPEGAAERFPAWFCSAYPDVVEWAISKRQHLSPRKTDWGRGTPRISRISATRFKLTY